MADGTKIQRVNFESDFTLRLKAVDAEGNDLDEFPSGDFEIVFTCGGRKYSCSRRGERYTNCKMNDDGTLTVVFDSHNLLPGVLRMKMFLHLPNTLYPDGEQTVAGGCIALGVELVACGGDDFATEFDAELVMPYAVITAYQMAVNAGYTGTEKEWLDMITHGVSGKAATVKVGTVTTVDAESDAAVTNSGTEEDAVLDFKIPKGDSGITVRKLVWDLGDCDTSDAEAVAEKMTTWFQEILDRKESRIINIGSISGDTTVAAGDRVEMTVILGGQTMYTGVCPLVEDAGDYTVKGEINSGKWVNKMKFLPDGKLNIRMSGSRSPLYGAAQRLEIDSWYLSGTTPGKRTNIPVLMKTAYIAPGDTVMMTSGQFTYNYFEGVVTEVRMADYSALEFEGGSFTVKITNGRNQNYGGETYLGKTLKFTCKTLAEADMDKTPSKLKMSDAWLDDGSSSAAASVLINGMDGMNLWNAINRLSTTSYKCFYKDDNLYTQVMGTLIPRAETQGQKITVSCWQGSHELEVLAADSGIFVFLSRMSNFMIVCCTDIDTVMWLSAPYNLLMGYGGGMVSVGGNAGTAFQKGGTKPSMPSESGLMWLCFENTSESAKNLITPVWQYTFDGAGKEHWVVGTADGLVEADDDRDSTTFRNDFTPVSVGTLGNRIIDEGGISSLGGGAQVTESGILCRLAYAAMTSVAPTGTDSFPCPVLMMRDRVSFDDDGALWVEFPLDALLADGGGQIAGRVAGGAFSPVDYRLAFSGTDTMTITTMPAVTEITANAKDADGNAASLCWGGPSQEVSLPGFSSAGELAAALKRRTCRITDAGSGMVYSVQRWTAGESAVQLWIADGGAYARMSFAFPAEGETAEAPLKGSFLPYSRAVRLATAIDWDDDGTQTLEPEAGNDLRGLRVGDTLIDAAGVYYAVLSSYPSGGNLYMNIVHEGKTGHITSTSDGVTITVSKVATGGGNSVTVDTALSDTSTNPVQNKAVAAAIGNIGTVLDSINGETV